MQSISSHKAIQQQGQNQGLIIDVREPTEFRDGHLPGAINLPSTKYDKRITSH
ncbi:MAG TPA: rhodanese-like domain-containing protein [Saprospiraceae bacterium]|nr:rhodanese-like domain-containing protein [Saprospiraceae bacterium]